MSDRCRTLQASLPKSQQCGQSATHDGRFPFSSAMVIAAMVIKNTLLRMSGHASYEGSSNGHHNDANRLKIGQ